MKSTQLTDADLRPIPERLGEKSNLLAKIDWYEYEDAPAPGVAVPEAVDASGSRYLQDVQAIMAQARPAKTCPRCKRVGDETDLECFRCDFRFNRNEQYLSELRTLGVHALPRQVRMEEKFTVGRLINAKAANMTTFQLRLAAERLRCASGFDELLSLPDLNIDHYPYQIETAKRVLRDMRGIALLADEVGMGKSIESGIILRELDARALADNILVLAPSSLVEVWEESMQTHFGMSFNVIRKPQHWKRLSASGPKRILMGLDLAKQPKQIAKLRQTEWDVLVVDEAHYLRNRSSERYRSLNRLRKRYCLLLTATPVQNHVVELFSLINLLKPGHLSTIRKFKREYFDGKTKKVRNSEALKRLLYQVMVRNRRSQVGLQLPRRLAAVVHLQASKAEQSLYNDFTNFVQSAVPRRGSTTTRQERGLRLALMSLQRQLASSPAALAQTLERMAKKNELPQVQIRKLEEFAYRARNLKDETKIKATLEIVQAAGGQFVIFVEYLRSLDQLLKALAKVGIPAVAYSGEMDPAKKTAAIAKFRSGEAKIFVATRTGSEGHNLQFCHQMINFDLPWNPMAIEQRIGRLHRIGQKDEVLVFNLSIIGTIEDKVLEILSTKLKMFNLIVGELDMILGQSDGGKSVPEAVEDAISSSATLDEARSKLDDYGETLEKLYERYQNTTKASNAQMDMILGGVSAAVPAPVKSEVAVT